ncbi:MAG TPA: hypothetical protein VNW06_03345 [Cytophagaceae bacterium]|jgi:hypothetical protein|nr:hypothetical protein [Cytophagaceae bacterium]
MKKYTATVLFFLSLLSFAKAQNTKDKTTPDTVSIGAYVISLHDIDIHDKEYTLRFWLWLLHNNPDFDFPYQTEVPNAKTLEKPDMMTDTIGGKIWCLMKMKATMKESWNVGDYPFDKQVLMVRVENTIYDKSKLIFKADTLGSNFDTSLTVDGWTITDFRVKTGISKYNTAFGDPAIKEQKSEYSHFDINIVLERNAWGLFFKLFMGMYIAFFISSVSFIIDPEEVEPRFGLPVGGLFAAVGNKYIIDSLLPETSEFTLVDSLHTITFMFIFFTVTFSAISLIWISKKQHNKALRLNKVGGSIIIGSYVLLNLIFIIVAIW